MVKFRPKMSEFQVREARILRATGFTVKDLADLYEVSESAMSKVVHGISHADAGGPVEPKVARADRPLPEHGRPGRYGYHGCRCDICRAGNAARCAGWRATQRVSSRAGALAAVR